MNSPLFVGIAGYHLSDEEKKLLKDPLVGGVILFERNYQTYKQICTLISDISRLKTPRLVICIDQEGGRVQRFKFNFTKLPAPGLIYESCNYDLQAAIKISRELSWLMASELICIGVDFSFAPVLDINFGVSRVIGDRSFGKTKDIISNLARGWVLGAREAGMISVGKHFPGHGAVCEDSHFKLPVDKRLKDDIFSEDISVFKDLIKFEIEGIMAAHVIYENCDKELASFSKYWLIEQLRNKLDFRGLIFSDDLSMHAANGMGNLVERSQSALEAGCDVILICNDNKAAIEVTNSIKDKKNRPDSGYKKIYMKNSIKIENLRTSNRWKEAVSLAKNICEKEGGYD